MKCGIQMSYSSICQINDRNVLCKSSTALNFWVIPNPSVSNHCWSDVQRENFFVCFCLGLLFRALALKNQYWRFNLIKSSFILSIKKKWQCFLKLSFFAACETCRQEAHFIRRGHVVLLLRKGHRNLGIE